MNFHQIDIENWNRKEHFHHYMNGAKCSFNLTANVDVTELLAALKDKKIKFYPAFIYMVTRIVNKHREFRTTFNEKGILGYWDEVVPNYTVFHKDERTFSALWTDYSSDFSTFYKRYESDLNVFGHQKGLWIKESVPPHTFSISSIPWVNFSSFELNLFNGEDYLLPIITCGKYASNGNQTLLPISIRVHHAACDGYHVGLFLHDLQQLIDDYLDWLA
ncbi:type A chloramphenicol O-acetyltransferase [Priestia filamentosa]|uniref:type A chloramphenicol O-acetyltransferase n=1 Tax=Priestia filamentosa TaxID=1402861 RepID=UPI002E239C0E|nr:type A chloramphenicol O-acetyltransferase [Priestia filamentosa]